MLNDLAYVMFFPGGSLDIYNLCQYTKEHLHATVRKEDFSGILSLHQSNSQRLWVLLVGKWRRLNSGTLKILLEILKNIHNKRWHFFKKKFIDLSLRGGRERGRKEGRERNIDLLFCLFMHHWLIHVRALNRDQTQNLGI